MELREPLWKRQRRYCIFKRDRGYQEDIVHRINSLGLIGAYREEAAWVCTRSSAYKLWLVSLVVL